MNWKFWTRTPNTPSQTASAKGVQADVFESDRKWGVPVADWAPPQYGEYYFLSTPIFAAVNIRARAAMRVPLRVATRRSQTEYDFVDPNHPLQRLMDRPNPEMTGPDLWAAMQVQRCLWGKGHLSNEINGAETELWPLRPDHLIPVAGDRRRHIRSYIYRGDADEVNYLPDEVTNFLNFNPLQIYAGASPIAALRLTADAAREGMKYNRDLFRRGGVPDFGILTEDIVTQPEIDLFYERWEKRYGSSARNTRPVIMPGAKSFQNMAFSNRDMEYWNLMAWFVEEAARAFGVPQPMLGSLREATLANVESLDEVFWTTTMIPECQTIAAQLTNDLFPKLGYPGLVALFDFSEITALREDEDLRRKREEAYLDRGVITIEEVRQARGMSPTPVGTIARNPNAFNPTSGEPGESETPQSAAHTEEHRPGRHAPSPAYPATHQSHDLAPSSTTPAHRGANGANGIFLGDQS